MLPILLLLACRTDEHPDSGGSTSARDTSVTATNDDLDDDGAPVGVDCDDADPASYPGAPEIWYDGIDEDCAGGDDWDADADGFAAPGAPGDAPRDCDDADPTVSPGVSFNDDLAALGIPVDTAETARVWPMSPQLEVLSSQGRVQHHATVAWGADGRWTAAWQIGEMTINPTALLRTFDGALAVDVPGTAPTAGEAVKPDIEAWSGGYVVAWEEGNGARIWLRGYDLDGVPTTEPTILWEGNTSEAPDLALYPDGSGIAAWNETGGTAGEGEHAVRRFGPDLQPVGERILIERAGWTVAEVAPRADGGYVVVATRKHDGTDHMEVYGRVVSGDGCVSNFRADQGESTAPSRPTLDVAPDGRIVATWRSKVSEGVGAGVYGRFFDPLGRARSDVIELSRPDEDANRPVVALWGDAAVFSWEGETNPDPLFNRHDVSTWVWDGDAIAPISARFLQSQPLGTSAERPAISVYERGDGTARLVTTWELNFPSEIAARITELSP